MVSVCLHIFISVLKIPTLSPWEPLQPCPWFVAGDTPQVQYHVLVHNLGLTVSLTVECIAHPQLDSGKLEMVTPNVANEHWVTITHNGAQEPVEVHVGVEEGAHHRGSRVRMTEHDEVGML